MFVVPIMLSFQSTRVDAPLILRRMRFVRFSSAWARQVCHLRLGWSCRMPDCLPCAFSVLSGEVSQSEGLLGFCLDALVRLGAIPPMSTAPVPPPLLAVP